MTFFVRVVVNAVALWLTSLWVPGFQIVPEGELSTQVLAVLLIALLFSLVNSIVKPVVKLIALPLYILTLGLFTLVVNALMLLLTAWLTAFTDFGLVIDGFWTAVLAALVISLLSLLIGAVVPRRAR